MTSRTDTGGSASDPPRSWRVCRQDDNGDRYVVEDGLTEAAARTSLAEFEFRGHNQLYWIEVEPEER